MPTRSKTKAHSKSFDERRFEHEYNKPLKKVVKNILIRPKYPKTTPERDLQKLKDVVQSAKKLILGNKYPKPTQEEENRRNLSA